MSRRKGRLRAARRRTLDAKLATLPALTPAELGASALVVAPHFDDETLGCGATIAAKVAAGARVEIHVMSDGAASHAEPGLSERRFAETVAACGVLKVDPEDLHVLDLPDGTLTDHRTAMRDHLAHTVRRTAVDQVFVPHRGDGHLDHTAVTEALFDAVVGAPSPPAVYEYPVWHWQQWPFVRLGSPLRRRQWTPRSLHGDAWRRSVRGRFGFAFSSTFNRRLGAADDSVKVAAISCYRSQLKRSPDDGRPGLEDVSDGDFFAVVARSDECFRVTHGQGLADEGDRA